MLERNEKTKTPLFAIVFVSTFFFASHLFSQTLIYSASDSLIYKEKISFAKKENLFDKPLRTVFVEIAKSFVGTDYKAHTIETEGAEKLKVNLSGLDCYTFVETSLAIARTIRKKDTTFAAFLKETENLRYRGGKLNGYVSRLHYFTDWIYDLSERGIVRDKTREIGGIPYDKKIDFMSTHANAYPQLKENPEFADSIAKTEREISSREIFYVPQEKIAEAENGIESGDIIAIATSIGGLDVSHVGIALKKKDGRVYLLHAPNVGYKVQISEKPLAEYILGHKSQIGIIAAEVLDVK